MTRILFLHEVGYFEKPIFEMHEFPEYLSERGHHVAFADFLESSTVDEATAFGKLRNGRVVPETTIYHFSQFSGLTGIAKRLWAVLTFPRFFRSVLKEFNPEIVVSYAVPTSGWQALHICRRLRIPYIFRAIDVSHKIRKSKFAPLIKLAERYVYRNSNWVSCNNPAMREYCTSLGASQAFSSVDFPPLDLQHFQNADKSNQSLRRALAVPDGSPVVLYMGSFFYFSGLDCVLRELVTDKSGAYVILVGGGEQEADLRDLVRRLKIEQRVVFTGFVDYQDLPAYLSIADVAVNPMVPSVVSDTALPNKVLQYMASGLPVVSTKLLGLTSTFGDEAALTFVAAPNAVLSAAVKTALDKRTPSQDKIKAVLQEFSIANTVDEFERLIIQVRTLT